MRIRATRFVFVLLTVFALAACVADPYADPFNGSNTIPNDEGGALLIEATRAAQRVISERKTATIQAATMIANQTREANMRQATSTAQALWVYREEMSADATDSALSIQRAQTRQAATDTAIAHSSQATATAEADAVIISTIRTAAAIQATATTYAATSTRAAQELQAALERHQATATAEALEIRRTQAQEDAARSQRWSDFFDTILKIILGIGSIALLVMLFIQLARYLDALALRQKLVETRSGTVLIFAQRGEYSAQIIKSTPNLLDNANDFEPSQAHMLQNEAPELLKITTSRGETFIAKDDPETEQREQNRRLALRLLRESIKHYGQRGFDARQINRLPTYRDLNWSSETWVRAVNMLKPHITTKQGRGGGTFIGEQYPTLMQLYTAVGERRIALNGAREAIPSPTANALAA